MRSHRSTANHALSLRLTDAQWRHLAAQAALNDVTLSEAARVAIERDLDAQPDMPIEGNAPGDPGLKYRTFLAHADFTGALEELQAEDEPPAK